nr:O-antigen ligase family protein [Acinetobacter tandoii]
MFTLVKFLKNKELLLALYFFVFIFGCFVGLSDNFYNELRILEIIILLVIDVFWKETTKKYNAKGDFLFFLFLIMGNLVWNNSDFIVFELLVLYLLYRSFFILSYNDMLSKIILISSFSIFLLFPFSIYSYLYTGVYENWYPMPWNIRIYNSYFVVCSIFSVWFYLKKDKYKNIYLFFIFLALLSILFDGGRSALISYTVFIALVCIFNKLNRLRLILVYSFAWAVYFLIIFLSPSNPLRPIIRDTTSGRYTLWEHAIQCWLNNPIFGCGFYQLDEYKNLPAHPHNLFIQILSETGLIGFSFLSYLIFSIVKNINIKHKNGYFLLASFSAIFVELSFSGAYIYPVTQVSFLWLFVFLLKNPDFSYNFIDVKYKHTMFELIIVFLIKIFVLFLFFYLFFNFFVHGENDLPLTPPRFWEYGYKLF